MQDGSIERFDQKISPCPSFPSGPEALWAGGQRGVFLPFVKEGKEGFSFQCLYNYGLIGKSDPEEMRLSDYATLGVLKVEGISDQFDLFSFLPEENGYDIKPCLYIFESLLI